MTRLVGLVRGPRDLHDEPVFGQALDEALAPLDDRHRLCDVRVEVEIIDPPLIVTMGATALAWALGPGRRLRDERGRIQPWNGRSLLVTYHPSAAIRFGPKGEPMAALREDLGLAAAATCAK